MPENTYKAVDRKAYPEGKISVPVNPCPTTNPAIAASTIFYTITDA